MAKTSKAPERPEELENVQNTTKPPTRPKKRRRPTIYKTEETTKPTKKPKKAKKPPTPAPKPGTPEFKRLCDEWYARLKDSGFKDLERPHPRTGFAGPDSWLNAKSLRSIADDYEPLKAEHFRKLSHFVTHRGHAWHKKPFYRFAARLYVEGHSYRAICKAARRKGFTEGVNVYAVWKCVRLLEQAAERWWARSVHGGGEFE